MLKIWNKHSCEKEGKIDDLVKLDGKLEEW